MGCATSSAGGGGGDGGVQEGPFPMHGAASKACASVKIDGKPYAHLVSKETNGGDAVLVDKWGLSTANPADTRYWQTNEVKLSEVKDRANGADIVLGDDSGLGMLFASHVPLQQPAACVPKSTLAPGGAVLLFPRVFLVDVFLTVDGVAKTNGHVCCGDPGSKEDAIAAAVKEVPFSEDGPPVKRALVQGPPGEQPFATLVSKQFKNIHFVDLTMRVAPGKSVDDVIMDESKAYLHSYINVCSELFAEIGEGKHAIEMRVAPRGVVDVSGDPDDLVIEVVGQKNGGMGQGSDKYFSKCAAFKSAAEALAAQGSVISDPSAAGMKCAFNLTLPASACKGGGAERFAQPFCTNFADDLEEHCTIAKDVANSGESGGAARSAFGKSPGAVAHIVLADEPGFVGNIGDFGVGTGTCGRQFRAWAFWLNPDDDDDDAQGLMVKFMVQRTDKKDGIAVPDPKWISTKFGMFPVNSLRIPNKNIRAAVERDASIFQVEA